MTHFPRTLFPSPPKTGLRKGTVPKSGKSASRDCAPGCRATAARASRRTTTRAWTPRRTPQSRTARHARTTLPTTRAYFGCSRKARRLRTCSVVPAFKAWTRAKVCCSSEKNTFTWWTASLC
ncbi:unnamed protein product [Ixodes persulcatus]